MIFSIIKCRIPILMVQRGEKQNLTKRKNKNKIRISKMLFVTGIEIFDYFITKETADLTSEYV